VFSGRPLAVSAVLQLERNSARRVVALGHQFFLLWQHWHRFPLPHVLCVRGAAKELPQNSSSKIRSWLSWLAAVFLATCLRPAHPACPAFFFMIYFLPSCPSARAPFCVACSLRLRSIRYCRSLEEGSFGHRSADFLWCLLFGMGALMAVAPWCTHIMFYGSSLTFMLVYLWGKRNPGMQISLLGLLAFNAPYLAWVLLGFSLLLGHDVSSDLLGIVRAPAAGSADAAPPLPPARRRSHKLARSFPSAASACRRLATCTTTGRTSSPRCRRCAAGACGGRWERRTCCTFCSERSAWRAPPQLPTRRLPTRRRRRHEMRARQAPGGANQAAPRSAAAHCRRFSAPFSAPPTLPF